MQKGAQKHQKKAFGNPTVRLLCLSSLATIGFVSCRILGSCTDLMQAIQVLVLASKDLQQEIVESGRVSLYQSCNRITFTSHLLCSTVTTTYFYEKIYQQLW